MKIEKATGKRFDILSVNYQLKVKDDLWLQGDSPEGIIAVAESYGGRDSTLVPGTSEAKYACGLGKCRKLFDSEEKATSHRAKSHPADRKFKCNMCPKAFKTLVGLRAHEKLKRSGYILEFKVKSQGFKYSDAQKLSYFILKIYIGLKSRLGFKGDINQI